MNRVLHILNHVNYFNPEAKLIKKVISLFETNSFKQLMEKELIIKHFHCYFQNFRDTESKGIFK